MKQAFSRRASALACALGVLLGSVGCSSDGTVVIQNRTRTQLTGSIDNRGFSLSGFESIEFTFKVGSHFLFLGSDEEDVTLEAESCTRFPFTRTVTVRGGDRVTNVTIEPDAACVVYENEAECRVDGIYVRESGEPDWGDNLLVGTLSIGESLRRRIALSAYDFLMTDQCGDSTMAAKEPMAGETIYVRHRSTPAP